MLISGPDPDWAKEQAARTANAINLFLNIQERHRTDRENERQRHMMLLAEHPQLADGDYGTMILKKYGGDDPLSSMVSTIRGRKAEEQKAFSEGALPFYQSVGSVSGRRKAEREALAKMDDTVPTFGHQGPGLFEFLPVPGPNIAKQDRAAALEQAPDITQEAFESLTPEQRNRWLTYAALHKVEKLPGGIEFEEGFDRTHLPPSIQAQRAVGAPMSKQRKAADIGSGLAPDEGTLLEEAEKARLQALNQGKVQDRIDERATKAATTREIAQNKSFAESRAAQQRTFGQQEKMAGIRADGKAEGGGPGGHKWKKDAAGKIDTNLDALAKESNMEPLPVTIKAGLRNYTIRAIENGASLERKEELAAAMLKGYRELLKTRTAAEALKELDRQLMAKMGGK